MSTYAVIGGTLWGNRGAEAMVATTIGRVRDHDPEASFLIMSYFPERDRELLTDPAVQVVDARPKDTVVQWMFALMVRIAGLVGVRLPDAMLPRSVRSLRRCRALFDVSGISFHDGRLAVVAYNLMCLWPAMLLKVPVVRLSQAMGPFRHPLNRLPARAMTKRSFHTFARGRHTADHLRRLGVPDGSWRVAADIAFAYRSSDSLTSENVERVDELSAHLDRVRADGTDVVAVVPSSLVMQKMTTEGADYCALLQRLIRHLGDRGVHVVVMPNATRAGVEGLRNNDLAVITKLRDRIRTAPDGIDPSAVSYVDFDLNTASIRRLAQPCTLLITSRFHAMVAGLALEVPTLVMGWSHKYEEILEMFGCEADAVDFSGAERHLLPMTDRMLDENDAIRERIRKNLPDVIASAQSQFDLLDRLPT
ncbi:polysaccharide pyruvyl transferase family protein [Phytoactinopolyspora endophytica]|uniref:polysaccharide pyruvyl transferase family protein n=1 Tax=Phytoactinopolyspora endophytica TaxID=1642495 RepID=UPI00101C9A19|nr:polysaccharide pyruvyl transferase family protein [Phytoactinopolyspora endophytica]